MSWLNVSVSNIDRFEGQQTLQNLINYLDDIFMLKVGCILHPALNDIMESELRIFVNQLDPEYVAAELLNLLTWLCYLNECTWNRNQPINRLVRDHEPQGCFLFHFVVAREFVKSFRLQQKARFVELVDQQLTLLYEVVVYFLAEHTLLD